MSSSLGPTPSEGCTYRAVVRGVEPDAVYRAVDEHGGYRSWEDPYRLLHRIDQNTVELYPHGSATVLLVNGPSVEGVRDGVRQLGYHRDDATVCEINMPRHVRTAPKEVLPE